MNNFKYSAYFLSQYIWFVLYILLPFCCFFLVPHQNNTGFIYSDSVKIQFNKSQKPTVFVHLSDLHINHVINYTVDHFNNAVDIINQIKPDFNIITGDLADNFPSDSMPRYGHQIPQDFELYENLIQRLSNYTNIEMDGNHDLFGVFDYESKKKTNKTQSYNDYSVFSTTFKIGYKNYTFIAMNPFNFPSPHPPFIFYAHPSTKFLDRLEDVISSIPTENEIIALSHFPMYQWNFGSKSSSKKDFHQIMKSGRIKLFLNGHLHPNEPCIQHHRDLKQKDRNGLLEIVGADLKQHHKIGICIFDNDRFSYHSIDVNENPNLAFITNPLPDEILSSHQIFNEKSTYLRIIVYKEKQPFIFSSGDVNGELECQKMDAFWICQTPMNLEYGKHSISLRGDLNKTIDFTIGDSISSFNENIYQFTTSEYYIYFVTLGILFFFLLFIHVPFHLNRQFEERYDLWLNGVEKEGIGMWIFSIFCGFYCVKMRIANMPIFFRVCLIIALIWPFLLPMMWISIQNHFGFVWAWGFICENYVRYGVWSQYLTLAYLAFVVLPVSLFCSMLYITNRFHFAMLFEILFQILTICLDFYIFLRFCNEASGMVLSCFSPTFVIFPLFFYISLILWRIFTTKGVKDDNNVVITQPLIE